MGTLAVLPVFFDLAGRRAIVAGRGEALVWKAELLAAAGAHVEAFVEGPSDEFTALCAAPPAGTILLVARAWQPPDLAGATLAVGAFEGNAAQAFARAARAHGVPVNIIDKPADSTFSFGSIVNRSPVVIGISTAGAAPVLSQAIRAKIEALLHPALAAWGSAARRLRAQLNGRHGPGPARREVWRRFAEAGLAARRAPRERELSELAALPAAKGGRVSLVGAGPGDPGLLTLKALRALQSADVIVYDRLVSAEILELARREAKRILVGKTGNGPACHQADINTLIVRLAGEGQEVVRLKGGDPMVFGRAAEEIEACRAAGVPIQVVPGITAALGAAAELQLPMTQRGVAARLQLVSGHCEHGSLPNYDWANLADPSATTVLYMCRGTFIQMLPKLIAAGLDPVTPAVVVVSATTPRCANIRCPVHEVPAALSTLERSGPCLIMIGNALAANVRAASRACHQRVPA